MGTNRSLVTYLVGKRQEKAKNRKKKRRKKIATKVYTVQRIQSQNIDCRPKLF